MASVPSATLSVAKYRSKPEQIDKGDSDEVMGWLTKNHTDNMPWVVRVKSEFYQVIMDAFPSYLHFIGASRNHGAVNGRAMLSTSQQVQTAGGLSRPRLLYRVINGRQPGNGIESRLGRGSDPIFLQLHFQKHQNPQCREKSPFLSATASRETALGLAAKYAVRDMPDVQIIEFKTSGPGWNHDVQRIWRARDLIGRFDLPGFNRVRVNNEYLVEHSIPEKSIVSRLHWKRDKDKLDPWGRRMREASEDLEAQKRSKNRANDKKKAAAEKRRADGLDEPDPKKRRTGKWVKVGVKIGRNTGA
ncbi:hypothetical protein LX36DRAFT_737535 [Colletotrichum falcatum]|nr:hypothetical protein LX36DRAFT_737535 [Colletotrichum falcatum]